MPTDQLPLPPPPRPVQPAAQPPPVAQQGAPPAQPPINFSPSSLMGSFQPIFGALGQVAQRQQQVPPQQQQRQRPTPPPVSPGQESEIGPGEYF